MVPWFLLRPPNFRVLERRHGPFNRLQAQRVELLQAHNRHVVAIGLVAVRP